MNKFKLLLGDWSGDGHKQYEEVIIGTSLTKDEVMESYFKSVKELKFTLHDEGIKLIEGLADLELEDQEDVCVCTNYEQHKISEYIIDILKKNQYPEEEIKELQEWADPDSFVKLFLWMVKRNHPNADLTKIQDEIEYLYGRWDKKYNFTLGYGLYE